jgi:hypothetical protein
MANGPYLQAIDAAVAGARERGWLAPPPHRYGIFETWFARSFEPPVRVRIRTPRRLVPLSVPEKGELLARFDAAQDELIRSLRGADGVDLGRTTMQSPYLRLVRLSVGRAFLVIVAHNRRHIWHARRILSNPAFPPG